MTPRSELPPHLQALSTPGMAPGGAPRSAFWRWLQSDLPWLAARLHLLVGALVLLLLGLGAQHLVAYLSQPPRTVLPVAQQQLRSMLDQVEECRGTESLLVMLPPGTEREAAVGRLLRQQRLMDSWLRDNGGWLAAAHGPQAVAELRTAATAWRTLQQRIVEADASVGRTGLVQQSRVLMTGPSAQAYQRLVATLERIARREAG
ncbi:MAG: hypothetical protein V4795_22965 [Pseudomonadota bacterium]